MKFALLPILILMLSAPAFAQVAKEESGDQFRITLFHTSESEGDNGSTSSSSGGHEYLERVLAVRSDGVERVYDLPLEPEDEERLINWQFPVRVFEAIDGHIEILNRSELEVRRDAWLALAEIPAEACDSWYFTWNAFQVECDPDAITETIRAIKIQPANFSEGAVFKHPAAQEPGPLVSGGSDVSGISYRASMPVNPDYFHRNEAQSDVVVGALMRKSVTFEDAYEKRKTERITGTIDVILEADTDAQFWKRTTSINTEKVAPSGEVERSVSIETVERTRMDDN